MEQRVLGKTGLKVSVLGLGGAELGFQGVTEASAHEIISTALEVGINFIDTAAAYLESERLLGIALKGRRDKFFLTTKCGPLDAFSRSDWSKKGILASIEQSLKSLQTDYLDIVYLHSCNYAEFLFGEAAGGLLAAKEKGYLRYMGYSGDSGAAHVALESGKFDVLETSCSIVDQEAIDLLLPLAVKLNIGVVAKRPVGNVAWKYPELPSDDYQHVYWRRFQKLNYPLQSEPLEKAVSTALKFTLSQAGICCAIVGTTKAERLRENTEGISKGSKLQTAEIEKIRKHWKEVADCSWYAQI